MTTLTRKTVAAAVRVKDADQGLVELAFARFNKIDRDGDVTLKGAFESGAAVVLSAYGHKSWEGALPYGHGTIRETSDEAVAEVKFLLDTTHGRDAFLTVKALSEVGLQEWSYSLEEVDAERGTFDGKAVRFLKRIVVKEVSPVLRGAGTDTRTLSAKSADLKILNSKLAQGLDDAGVERYASDVTYPYCVDFDHDAKFAIFGVYSNDEPTYYVKVSFTIGDGDTVVLGDDEVAVEREVSFVPKAKFSEHATAVLAAVDGLTARASEVVAIRAEKGKSISDASRSLLEQVGDRLDALKVALSPTAESITDGSDELAAILLADIARRHGVTP